MPKQTIFHYVSGPANGESDKLSSDVWLVHIDMDTGLPEDQGKVASYVAVYKRVGDLLVFMGAKERP